MITITASDPDCRARTGILHLPKGDVPIPAFMPVGTNGTVKAILHSSLEEIGYPLILGNTYHLYLRPGTEVIGKYGSLHKFSSWKGNILTDSGGFQVFSLSSFRKISSDGVTFQSHIDGSRHHLTPEKVVEIQTLLGSDIQMQLDVCTEPGINKKEALKALELTTEWAKRAKQKRSEQDEHYKGSLFGIVQGNFYKELREQSAGQLTELNLPGYAIGGLSVGEEPEVFNEYLHFTAPLLPDEKPKYVMGIGTPDYMLEAMEAGIDLFDCVYPTRVARNGTCFTLEGMLNLKNARFKDDMNPIDNECRCSTCSRYTRGYLRHLFSAREILGPMLVTHHNLHFLYSMMEQARASIAEGRFMAFKKSFMERFRGMV
ncbi:MAG: tRNA guanosine(34) transglycosylase Tgt [Spirochaetes bacterium]|nr:MAG: tRNA guanosine(34) transglycosylase Tgt [Spirochaetota bacterium]RKX88664.1 MAG: tRNA guanosine(34) transglycosylase Tgt [Spirochaetota bacterium]RKX99090.1 MAG: tRNA guanosine(34) transglycosylase Tgt [Spirochaetota bacterium]